MQMKHEIAFKTPRSDEKLTLLIKAAKTFLCFCVFGRVLYAKIAKMHFFSSALQHMIGRACECSRYRFFRISNSVTVC